MADVLRLETDVPTVIALEYPDGRTVSTKYGDQVLFSLCDGRITFLPPFVARKIADSGIRPNEPFEICKRSVTRGNRRTVEYQMGPVSNGNGNGNGHGLHAVPLPAAPLALPTHQDAPVRGVADSSAVEFMKLAGRGAIDAVVDVEEYAKSRGLSEFVFDSLSVQKIMVSLYIDLRKGGRA